jgi:6-pyruvoyltetrahydropterin/6-carboxytetrahydropterin synthase
MFMIVRKFEIHAAHRLPKHKGKCKNIHGHQWVLEVGVTGPLDEETGMITDFSNLKNLVNELIIDKLDHQYLNELEIEGFPSDCPTAEKMSIWMISTLNKYLKDKTTCELALLRLYETDNSYFEWRY